jgi:hypothetical protein
MPAIYQLIIALGWISGLFSMPLRYSVNLYNEILHSDDVNAVGAVII